MLSACTSPKLKEEAQAVVAQADSLRAEGRMYGIDEGDSATLAQAYETLKKHSAFCRRFSEHCSFVPCTSSLGTYAHACYHYGRLLRERDNPVAAMQCFIDASHSRTRDYHILGRVYSNMGSIAHLAGEYALSYDMYERSAASFLKNGDTLLYYYGIYRMAFEKAESADSCICLSLLQLIEQYPQPSDLLGYVALIKSELYLRCLQYDSAIYYAHQALYYNHGESNSLMMLAQAYSFMGIQDSAAYFAERVLAVSGELGDQNNALYILTNDDKTKDLENVRKTASERADIQKQLEIRRGKISQAVQLLQQDLERKPDWRWLYVLFAILLFLCSGSILYSVWRKRKQHRELIVDLREKEKEQFHLENTINSLSQLQEAKHLQIRKEAEEICRLLGNSADIRAELCWSNYAQMCATVNLRLFGIINRLQSFSLSEKEMRLCVLILLQASTEQMVDMIPYSHSGLGKFKYTTARKLGTTTANFRSFLLDLMG